MARVAWAVGILALASASHLENVIQRVRPCEGTSASLCLQVDLDMPESDLAYITCLAYTEDRRSPHFHKAFGPTVPSAGVCNSSAACVLDVERDATGATLRMSTEYYVFCSGFTTDDSLQFKRLNVAPQCDSGTCGIEASTGSGPAEHAPFALQIVLACSLLLVYIGWSFLFARFRHLRFLHETGVAVLAGLVAGVLLKLYSNEDVRFDYELFSLCVLPMVIFCAGYNLPKRSFFQYLSIIAGLGVTGTFLIFVFIYWFSTLGKFRTQSGLTVHLQPHHRLIMASVLASTDSVAPMAFLPADLFPEIYAVVFGEGVLNDVVAVMLSSATGKASSLTLASVGQLWLQIGQLLVTSSALGLAFGLGTSLLFKLGPLRQGCAKPAAAMLLLNYACYGLAELLEVSSIFALFLSALCCGHYAHESMSHAAQELVREASELLCYLAEAFVFGYFGLTSVTFIWSGTFSPKLILVYVAAIFAARVGAVVLLVVTLRLLNCGHRLLLKYREFGIIGFAGCMRGTIAYALILKAVPPSDAQGLVHQVMLSTVLGIVLVNCLVMGGIFPLVLGCLGITPTAEGAGPTGETLHDQTLGLLPHDHRLRPANLRAEARGRWRRFDEGKMQRWFRAAPEKNSGSFASTDAGEGSCQSVLGSLPNLEDGVWTTSFSVPDFATLEDAPVTNKAVSHRVG